MQNVITFLIFILSVCIAKGQPFGRFASFDGIDDNYSIFSSVIPSNSDCTIEFWVKTCTQSIPSPAYTVLSNGAALEVSIFDGSNLRTHQLCLDDANITYFCHQDHSYPSKDSLWHHVAITYDWSSDHFEMYFDGIDGTLSTMPTYNYSPGVNFALGDGAWGQWSFNKFRGYLDELRVSNIIRYSAGFTPPQTSFSLDSFTVGLWHFEETNPVSIALDESSNSYHLTPSGSPVSVPLDSILIQGTSTLMAPNNFNNYQWIDCADGSVIAGANSASYSPVSNGTYAVVVSDYLCPVKSNCVNVTHLEVSSTLEKEDIAIFPNPTERMLTVELGEKEAFCVELFDVRGRCLLTQESVAEIELNLTGFGSGAFWVRVYTADKSYIQKIILHN